MYGTPYNQNINPASSPPPLHHPGKYSYSRFISMSSPVVPVHPIPPVRSPPPTQPLQHQYNPAYAQQQQHGPHNLPQPQYAQQFGQFLGVNDATAQMGLHVMGNVMGTGQEYMEQNVLRFVNTRALKP